MKPSGRKVLTSGERAPVAAALASGIAREAEAIKGERRPAWSCTQKALGPERRPGLTPVQTCRCAARPPR